MRHSKKPWKGRARDASARDAFERALRGHEDDGDKRPFDPAADRKTLQLCRQVYRALTLELAGDADDTLASAFIDAVDPLGGPSQLLVRVVVPSAASPADVLTRLHERTPALRAAVARAICRKRVPALSFIAVPAAGGRDE